MLSSERKIQIARLFGAGGFACGLIGLAAGLLEHEWRLAVTGWFTGGTLLAVLAALLLADVYVEFRRSQHS